MWKWYQIRRGWLEGASDPAAGPRPSAPAGREANRIGQVSRRRNNADRLPPATPFPICRRYGCGRGVAATLGGRMGKTTSGWRPVSDLRNSVTLSISLSLSFWPS